MPTMRAIQVSRPGGPFELVEKPIPTPGPGEIRIKIQACGVCHSDLIVKEGLFPGIQYPRVPGHEIIGVIDAVGSEVKQFQTGRRVGVGWHGGHCFVCDRCRHGDFITCSNAKITGISFDGGYAEYCIAPQEAVALVPDGLQSAASAPLLCAGITTYNALRNSGARGGDLVAVQGIGGLGHLGIQFARALGFNTVAISGSESKRELALQLGAHHYIAADNESPAQALQKLGGARVILATSSDAKSMQPLIDGLGADGKLLIVGASAEPIEFTTLQLIMARRSIAGWPSGDAMASEETLNFAALTNTRVMVEEFPLELAREAYDRMMSNKARFRVVLTMQR
jgi:alcohol dehydrogenase, propanol-preferring